MPYEDEFAHYRPLKRVAESEQVQNLLKRTRRVKSDAQVIESLPAVSLAELKPSDWTPDYVIAVDGSFAEIPVDNGYPSASVGYVTVASVMLDVAKMQRLDVHRPIDPKEFRTLENAESVDGALPGSNVILDNELNAAHSFRRALFELFYNRQRSSRYCCGLARKA